MTKIGDIITALPVPDDVIEMTGDDGDPWRRGDDGLWTCRDRRGHVYGGLSGVGASRMLEYAPLRVVEVAASGPLVLTLPEVPAEAVALIGGTTGTRYGPVRVQGIVETCWMAPGRAALDLGAVLDGERSVTVEFAPPREPRTWSKLDAAEDMPAVVEVEGNGRWRRCTGVSWRYEPCGDNYIAAVGDRATLEELRALGEVREVLDA